MADGTAGPGARRPELDALRTLVVVGLVFFHGALVFDTRDDYYVKNAETTEVTMIFAGLAVVWAMPMLFLISGIGSWHSIRRRGTAGFARERLLRLGVPLVVATLTIMPVPQWLRLRADPGYRDSYLDFLPQFYSVRFEPSDFPFVLDGSYFETGHLWFVVLLLAFSLLLAPLARWSPRRARRDVLHRLAAGAAAWRGAALLPAVPVALITASVGMEEAFAGWSRWAYLLFFAYGFVLAADERFAATIRRDAGTAALLGVAAFLAGLPAFLVAAGDPFTDMTGLAILGRALYGIAGWCALVAIIGLLDRRRHRRPAGTAETGGRAPRPDGTAGRRSRGGGAGMAGRVHAYLSAGVLALYVLHQPILVAVAYGVVGWSAPVPVKYAVIVAVSLALTVAAYELLVRRTRVTRLLFGLRPGRPETAPGGYWAMSRRSAVAPRR